MRNWLISFNHSYRLHSGFCKSYWEGILLQLEEFETAPKNERESEGDDEEEEEGGKEGKDNSDEEKHQVELKKTQWVARFKLWP